MTKREKQEAKAINLLKRLETCWPRKTATDPGWVLVSYSGNGSSISVRVDAGQDDVDKMEHVASAKIPNTAAA